MSNDTHHIPISNISIYEYPFTAVLFNVQFSSNEGVIYCSSNVGTFRVFPKENKQNQFSPSTDKFALSSSEALNIK